MSLAPSFPAQRRIVMRRLQMILAMSVIAPLGWSAVATEQPEDKRTFLHSASP
jgi:hypothetical protein